MSMSLILSSVAPNQSIIIIIIIISISIEGLSYELTQVRRISQTSQLTVIIIFWLLIERERERSRFDHDGSIMAKTTGSLIWVIISTLFSFKLFFSFIFSSLLLSLSVTSVTRHTNFTYKIN